MEHRVCSVSIGILSGIIWKWSAQLAWPFISNVGLFLYLAQLSDFFQHLPISPAVFKGVVSLYSLLNSKQAACSSPEIIR